MIDDTIFNMRHGILENISYDCSLRLTTSFIKCPCSISMLKFNYSL